SVALMQGAQSWSKLRRPATDQRRASEAYVMQKTTVMDASQLEDWLEKASIEHYTCDQCNGLHLPRLQELEGVVDSRLFVESWGILLSTEFVIRPTAMLVVAADSGRLNMDYPTLKLFLDVVDDAMPQLVTGATLLTGAGVTPEQFRLFISSTVDAVTQVGAELAHLDYLLPEEGSEPPARQSHVH
ncbi:MAG: YbjN domain-containing protein, partial [Spongiibacteraceae bacterium]